MDNKECYLFRDNDILFREVDFQEFGINDKRITKRSPEKNAVIERFIGSLTREALNHFKDRLDIDTAYELTKSYVRYHNNHRPHQGLGNITIPEYKKLLLKKLNGTKLDLSSDTDDSFLFYDLKEQSSCFGLLKHYYFDNRWTA
jgi:Integrase core domain